MDVKHEGSAGHADSDNHPAQLRNYVFVWIALVVLTATTVLSASLRLGAITIVVCLAIAASKSILVLLYFMHLRHEKTVLLKILIPIVIAVLAIFIGLTYSDIMTR
jgi:cytochrome c oxidase subunit IV